ncbi:glycosyltransferase domain-containing protein [Haloarchaeobius amylolyticus]|uniref:Glycosyltransferase domain-containing protein n=1 Tax=Haloarchaeobius amylolyticus TaxID=1198296 RepID=A0ABD6BDH0_9EURY
MPESKHIAVYTAVFGDYDVVLPPLVNEDRIDYICFTDNPSKIPSPWEVREISVDDLSPKLTSGKVKVLPHKYLPEYERSIWIDANIAISDQIAPLADEVLQGADLAVPQHPLRDCIYEEAEVCVDQKLIEPDITEQKMDKYREIGFPQNFGLSETRILIRDHQDPQVVETMRTWWKEYKEGPERDQLSFDYSLWECDPQYYRLPADTSTNSKHFEYSNHKKCMMFENTYEYLLRVKWKKRGSLPHVFYVAIYILYLLFELFIRAINTIRNEGVDSLRKKIIRKINKTEFFQ